MHQACAAQARDANVTFWWNFYKADNQLIMHDLVYLPKRFCLCLKRTDNLDSNNFHRYVWRLFNIASSRPSLIGFCVAPFRCVSRFRNRSTDRVAQTYTNEIQLYELTNFLIIFSDIRAKFVKNWGENNFSYVVRIFFIENCWIGLFRLTCSLPWQITAGEWRHCDIVTSRQQLHRPIYVFFFYTFATL